MSKEHLYNEYNHPCTGAQNTCSKVHATLTAKKMHIYIYIHTYAYAYICTRNTHVHLWHRPNTLKNSYWDSKSIHKHAYTYIYTCIYMHAYTYTYTHVYACSYTHIHIHIYTHTYSMYICTYTSTPRTTALQRLREEPDLTPRKLCTSPKMAEM